MDWSDVQQRRFDQCLTALESAVNVLRGLGRPEPTEAAWAEFGRAVVAACLEDGYVLYGVCARSEPHPEWPLAVTRLWQAARAVGIPRERKAGLG